MPALSLNGITVPIASWQRDAPAALGEPFARGTSGRGISSSRSRRQRWQGRTAPLALADASYLRALIDGRGHSWSFDATLYADGTSLGPASAIGCSSSAVVGSKWGAAVGRVNSPNYLQYNVEPSSEWTITYWKRPIEFYVGLPTFWDHWIHTSALPGYAFKNGVIVSDIQDGPQPSLDYDYFYVTYDTTLGGLYLSSAPGVITPFDFVSYGAGSLISTVGSSGQWRIFGWVGGGGVPAFEPDWDSASGSEDTISDGVNTWSDYDTIANTYYDDLTFLPAALPIMVISSPPYYASSFAQQIYAEAQARAVTSQPDLRAAGDLPGPARTVRGAVSEGEPREHKRSGTWERGGEALGFTLTEAT